MAQAQQNISLQAPSFQGVNTEDSPLSQDITFAARADNAVIDELGRIGSRKGFRAKVASYDFSNITPPAHDDYLISVGALHHSTDLSPVAVIKAEWRTGGTITATSYHIATLTLSNDTLTVCTEPGNVSSNLGAASMNGQFARFGDLVYLFADGFSPLNRSMVISCASNQSSGCTISLMLLPIHSLLDQPVAFWNEGLKEVIVVSVETV